MRPLSGFDMLQRGYFATSYANLPWIATTYTSQILTFVPSSQALKFDLGKWTRNLGRNRFFSNKNCLVNQKLNPESQLFPLKKRYDVSWSPPNFENTLAGHVDPPNMLQNMLVIPGYTPLYASFACFATPTRVFQIN